jgi:hypothetical protein
LFLFLYAKGSKTLSMADTYILHMLLIGNSVDKHDSIV